MQLSADRRVDAGLRDVHQTSRLRPYLRDLWGRRGYVWYVALSELRNRQMTSVLGNVWHLLNPILQILIYYLVFGLFLDGVDRGVDNYILFVSVGVFMFADMQRSTTQGSNSIVNNRGLLQAIRFPRALLPVTSTLVESLATLPSLAVVYFVAVATDEPVRWTWLLLPMVVVVQFFFNLGLAMLAARSTNHVRDLQQLLPFVFRILIYTSGVIFSVDAFAEETGYQWLFDLNPIYCYMSIGRWTMVGGDLRGAWVTSALAWTVLVLVIGFVWFRAAEEEYGRD